MGHSVCTPAPRSSARLVLIQLGQRGFLIPAAFIAACSSLIFISGCALMTATDKSSIPSASVLTPCAFWESTTLASPLSIQCIRQSLTTLSWASRVPMTSKGFASKSRGLTFRR